MGVTMPVEAKGKVKKRHAMAISQFQAWKAQNPNASAKEKVEMFDQLVDSALYDQVLNAASR